MLFLRTEITYTIGTWQIQLSMSRTPSVKYVARISLYVIEVKFSRNKIKSYVIEEVREKINNISLPRGVAVLPVLVHVNGVSDKIKDADYFHKIIDFGELLM